MVRTATHLAICAILGCLTSIAVAWGFALAGERPAEQFPLEVGWKAPGVGNHVIVCHTYGEVAGVRKLGLYRGDGLIRDTEVVRRPRGAFADWWNPCRRLQAPPIECNPPDGRHANCRSEFQFGWPLVCMWAGIDTFESGDILGPDHASRALELWPSPRSLSNSNGGFGFTRRYRDRLPPQSVPTGVLWTGLATNTACYATTWWLILLAPAQLRTFIRKRRGQCMRCAYDLRATPPGSTCPECGTRPLPSIVEQPS